ncbi:ARM repeat-containing protein [Glarea lozoyensis ATCC 20868]|uniref:MMS19 nucleotide excision repair protein n=1 Tax=Glarea lozoyensis (strain ATCC 20868 / MF5171) TaxID=1116229 RepID=S3D350_GLAL2|nr:ARM repeat-containing protein [Glarea lozoyensis ATCC 20868]EPE31594.1 ARM repeat-containing protein [Glarea lozoyensis ATCC 20868]
MSNTGVQEWMVAPSLKDDRNSAEQDIVTKVAESCDAGSIDFPTLIKDLEPYVGTEQEDLVVVGRGMALLPLILDHMKAEPRTRQDVQLLVTYLCLRLKNESEVSNFRYGLDQIADCLLILTKWKKFVPSDSVVVAKSIFSLAAGKINTFIDLTPSTRLKFYKIIWVLVENYERPLLRDMGGDSFVGGLVELSELEKSAICLKDLFALYSKIGKAWSLTPDGYTQLWDCFIRYFPITLGASQKDDQPKPEELKDLLRQCFTANDFFGKAAFETLLGNIDADQGANKKKEILLTLDACVSTYSIKTLLEWSSKIWDTIKFEIWNGENDEFIADALHILNGLFSTLSRSDWSWDESTKFSSFIDGVVKEIFDRLSDMQRYVAGSARMLLAIGSSSSLALRLVMKQTLPGIISMAQDDHAKVSKKSLFSVFNAILQARVDLAEEARTYENSYQEGSPEFHQTPQSRAQDEHNLVQDMIRFREPLSDLYLGAISEVKSDADTDSALATAVVQGLVLLIRVPNLFEEEKRSILQILNQSTLDDSTSADLQSTTLSAIREIATFDPLGFQETTLPQFIKRLPEEIIGEDQSDVPKPESELAMRYLENLGLIGCTSLKNHDELQSALIKKFDQTRARKGQLTYLNILIAAARRALGLFDSSLPTSPCDARISNPLDERRGPYAHIVFPFLDRIIGVSQPASGSGSYIGLQNSFDDSQPFDDFTVDMLGQMITTSMTSEFYELDQTSSEMTYKKTENILQSFDRSQPEGTPSALQTLFRNQEDLAIVKDSFASQFDFDKWPLDRVRAASLTTALLAGVNPKDKSQLPLGIHVGDVAAAMIKGSISRNEKFSQSRLAKVSMLSLLQLLVNKFGAASQHPSTGDISVLQIMLDLVDGQASGKINYISEEVENIYRTLAYFSAASLAAYSAESATQLVERMLSGVTLPNYGQKVAQSFRLLLAPSPILNKQHFCTIRPLRKGRLFDMAGKRLIEMWRSESSPETKANCLVALAGIVAYIDASTLVENIDLVFPAFLEGTNIVSDEWAKATFIQTIHTLVPLAPKTIVSHLDSIINRMTLRTRYPKDNSPKCRVMALEVLRALVAHVDKGKLIARKFLLIAEVDVALNDPSREVRSKAAACKIAWFNLT